MSQKQLIIALVCFGALIVVGKVISDQGLGKPDGPVTVGMHARSNGQVVTFQPYVKDAKGKPLSIRALPRLPQVLVTDSLGNEVYTGRFSYG